LGRSSSTGFPFLVQRSDAGQFTYHRDIPAALAPLVKGEVMLPWADRTRRIEGKATIKISLATGNDKTAKQRWAVIHPQVEALVQMAGLRTDGPAKAHRDKAAPRLDAAQVRSIADQAYHDVLADDDRGQVEPGFVSPLAAVLIRVARGAMPAGAQAVHDAEVAARMIEERVHVARLRDRTTSLMDKPIFEGELGDETLEALSTGLKKGDRLAPEQVEALALGIRLNEIPGEVEQRLRENGLDLPQGHIDRRALALAITRAKVQAFKDVSRRDCGAPIQTPERPAVVQSEPKPSVPVPLLSAMQERWVTLARPGDKQIGDNARYVRLFVSLHGDLPVDQITGVHIRAFRDALLDCPRNAPKSLAQASVPELAAWAKANPTKPKLGRGTINHKGLGSISTLLEQALKDEHIRSNPAVGQQLPTRASDKQHRRPYTVGELNRVLQSGIYEPYPRIPAGGKGWAAWWLPLMSLFGGARLEELGQALVSDIKSDGKIHYIEVTTLADEDDDERTPTSRKKLKSDAARRRIPLHPVLIQLGLLDYVASLRTRRTTRLFPTLGEYRGRYTKNWSRWWGRWLTKLGLTDPALTFHSFRHTFVAELRRLKCNSSIMKELLGHAQTDVTSEYGRTDRHLHELGDLNDEIMRITFKTLDVERLYNLMPWRLAQ
jgi:integrase